MTTCRTRVHQVRAKNSRLSVGPLGPGMNAMQFAPHRPNRFFSLLSLLNQRRAGSLHVLHI